MSEQGFVYAIVSGDAVKIGWSKDPHKRIHNLQIGSCADQRLIGCINGTKEREAELHCSFQSYHIRGEWFRHEGPVASFVSSLPAPIPKARKLREPKSAKETRYAAADYPRRFGPVRRRLANELTTICELWLGQCSEEEQRAGAFFISQSPNGYSCSRDGSASMHVMYTEPLHFFSKHWPTGIPWPSHIDRPLPSATIAARMARTAAGHFRWEKQRAEDAKERRAAYFSRFAGITAGLVQ